DEASPALEQPGVFVPWDAGANRVRGHRPPVSLLFADVLVPDLGVGRDVAGEHVDALARVEIDDLDPVLAEPVDAAWKVDRLPDDDRTDAELADQPAAVPAGRQRRDHDRVAIASLPAGIAESVGLAVHRRVVLLDAPVVASPEQPALGVEERAADRDAAL